MPRPADAEIARTLKAAEEKKALEEEIVKRRAEEIAQGRAEIQGITKKYNLSAEEAFGPPPPAGHKTSTPYKRPGYLSEIRQYYNGRFL